MGVAISKVRSAFCTCSIAVCDTDYYSSVDQFYGNCWKLALVVSFTAVGLEPHPSITFKGLAVDCSLVPRNIPGNTRKSRKPSTTFKISHRGRTVTINERGCIQPMNPDYGIYKDRIWWGPNPAGTRIKYVTNIYIPIPFWIFSTAETRTFEFQARAWVSIAQEFPIELSRTAEVNFTNFVRMDKGEDSKKCSLLS